MPNMTKSEELALQKRGEAKRILGECLERSGYLNPASPLSRFVDAMIEAVICELAARNSSSSPLHNSAQVRPLTE